MSTLVCSVAAWPFSSKAITITAAPYRLMRRAWSMKTFSPSLSEMELTMHLPCRHCTPASRIANLDESITMGTLAISGSVATRLQNRRIIATPSSMPSSKLKSRSCAPLSTCARATARARSMLFSRIIFLNRAEPATLQRSPMLAKLESEVIAMGSRPDNRSAGGCVWGLRGAMPLTASLIALMCSGVVPQHPPTKFKKPERAHSEICTAMSAGVRS
mmetsp:Transcript_2679/g.6396  ORF Transcript_2679/g.6396 Transcript_2679/m.6396 type:complete len:217 (+) Transcript_2679:2288-2938(+)